MPLENHIYNVFKILYNNDEIFHLLHTGWIYLGKEYIDDTRNRNGIKERKQNHW